MTDTDLVVVLPGITGSTLHQHGKPVWEPSGGAILKGLRTLGRSLKQLQLPAGVGEEDPGDGVEAVAVMPDVHVIPGVWSPIQGYTALLNRLERMRDEKKVGKVLPFPYDWRLSNRYSGQRLAETVERELGRWRESDPSRADAQVVLVCHSMGGLVARWYIEKCGGAEVTRKLITLGTPYRGAAKTIDQIVNGVTRKLGPFAVDLTAFARSMPSSYQLLPEYACIDHNGDLRRIDEVALPDVDTGMRDDALRFHRDLAAAEVARPASQQITHAIVGTRQPTASSVRLTPTGIEVLDSLGADDYFGDATVPLAGALKHTVAMDDKEIYRIVDRHGSLQSNRVVLDQVEEIITATQIKFRAGPPAAVRADAPELVVLGEPLTVTADIEPDSSGRIPAVRVTLTPAEPAITAKPVARQPPIRNGHTEVTFTPAQPGTYHINITGTAPGSPIAPVTAIALIWAPETA
jgi:pimeloyl-ACP methyl ester carboxylesterase